MRHLLLLLLPLLLAAAAAAQQGPDVAAQKAAMQKLAYLVGTWNGEATVFQQSGPVKVKQTEQVEFKLDGLVMVMEGTGRNEAGDIKFRAFATIAYDDAAKVYRFRSYNDGRYLDTEMKVVDQGFEWGYQAGPAKVRFVMTLTPKGEWHEDGEVVIGSTPPRKTLDMTVRK
jgi:hypothetical protein